MSAINYHREFRGIRHKCRTMSTFLEEKIEGGHGLRIFVVTVLGFSWARAWVYRTSVHFAGLTDEPVPENVFLTFAESDRNMYFYHVVFCLIFEL